MQATCRLCNCWRHDKHEREPLVAFWNAFKATSIKVVANDVIALPEKKLIFGKPSKGSVCTFVSDIRSYGKLAWIRLIGQLTLNMTL